MDKAFYIYHRSGLFVTVHSERKYLVRRQEQLERYGFTQLPRLPTDETVLRKATFSRLISILRAKKQAEEGMFIVEQPGTSAAEKFQGFKINPDAEVAGNDFPDKNERAFVEQILRKAICHARQNSLFVSIFLPPKKISHWPIYFAA